MTTTTRVLALPNRLQRGEIRFSINLEFIDDVPALYKLVESLGFPEPQLVTVAYPAETEIHLLLHREIRQELNQMPDTLYQSEQQVLANAIDTEAIRFSCGLTRAHAIAA